MTGWNAPATPPAGRLAVGLRGLRGRGRRAAARSARYAVESGALVFRAAYPISPGVRYRAVFHPPGGGRAVEQDIRRPAADDDAIDARRARVSVGRRAAEQHAAALHLLLGADEPRRGARGAFTSSTRTAMSSTASFCPDEELWDPNNQRLTMTFDPGRIKRGLTSNEKMGPPIARRSRATRSRSTAIGRTPRGVPLVEGFRKLFRGGPALANAARPGDVAPDAARGRHVRTPAVSFPRPMNYALLQRMLQVSGPRGRWPARSASIGRKPSGVHTARRRGRPAPTGWSWTPGSKTSPATTSASSSTSTSSSASPNTSRRRRVPFRADIGVPRISSRRRKP